MNVWDKVTALLNSWPDFVQWCIHETEKNKADSKITGKKARKISPTPTNFALQSPNQVFTESQKRKKNDGGWLQMMGFAFRQFDGNRYTKGERSSHEYQLACIGLYTSTANRATWRDHFTKVHILHSGDI